MRFTSKQNRVILKDGIVYKSHKNKAVLLREAAVLQQLYEGGLAVPRLIGRDGNDLKLEYIAGSTYVDLVDQLGVEQAEALATWLADYHRLTGWLRGDCNLRNFLWSAGRCVGVDFEEPPVKGDQEEDFGKVLAFTATYDPIFTKQKINSCNLLFNAFKEVGGSRKKIKVAYLAEISAMVKRRRNFAVSLEAVALIFDQFSSEKIQT